MKYVFPISIAQEKNISFTTTNDNCVLNKDI